MKKNILVFCSLLIVTLFFAGCGKHSNSEVKVNSAALADTQNSYNKVYALKNVMKGAEGMAVNFNFDEKGALKSFSEVTKGKVVFLNFWGTWCGPCKREIPDIIKLQEKYQSKNLMVVGIALERNIDKAIENVSNFGSKQGMNYMNIIGNEAIGEAYGGISAVPTTFIIDSKGVVVEKVVGSMSLEDFEKVILKYL